MLATLHPATTLDAIELLTIDDIIATPSKARKDWSFLEVGRTPAPTRGAMRKDSKLSPDKSGRVRYRDMKSKEWMGYLLNHYLISAGLDFMNDKVHRSGPGRQPIPSWDELREYLAQWTWDERYNELTDEIVVLSEYDAVMGGSSKGVLTDTDRHVDSATDYVLDVWDVEYIPTRRAWGSKTKWNFAAWVETLNMTQVKAAEVLGLTRQTVATMRKHYAQYDDETLALMVEEHELKKGNRDGEQDTAEDVNAGSGDLGEGRGEGNGYEPDSVRDVASDDVRGGASTPRSSVQLEGVHERGECVERPAWLVSEAEVAAYLKAQEAGVQTHDYPDYPDYLTDQGDSTDSSELVSGSSDENDTHFLETEPAKERPEHITAVPNLESELDDILTGRTTQAPAAERTPEQEVLDLLNADEAPVLLTPQRESFAFAPAPDGWDAG